VSTHDVDPPTLDEVFQAEDYAPNDDTPVAVTIGDPVKTQDLPCVATGMKRFTFRDGTAQPVRIVPASMKRSKVTMKIITDGGIFHMGLTAAQAISETAPQWGGPEPCVLSSSNEIWACAPIATVLAPITITVIVEDWAS
jgi:hypothetical protein